MSATLASRALDHEGTSKDNRPSQSGGALKPDQRLPRKGSRTPHKAPKLDLRRIRPRSRVIRGIVIVAPPSPQGREGSYSHSAFAEAVG